MRSVGCATTPENNMTFFVTSAGSGKGADLGGLAGADAHCQKLAAAAGAGNRTWRAYLSSGAPHSTVIVNARDRIGQGPWYNSRGAVVAKNLADLHGDTLDQARIGNALGKQYALTEKGTIMSGFGDTPNQHDLLTGSQPDGRGDLTRAHLGEETGDRALRGATQGTVGSPTTMSTA